MISAFLFVRFYLKNDIIKALFLNKNMKIGFWRRFFMVMGIIFTVLIVLFVVVIVYAVIAFKSFTKNLEENNSLQNQTTTENIDQATSQNFDHPLLNASQETLLKNLGVDVSKLPTELTEEQITCAVAVLGETRVKEILAGSNPTVTDYFKAKDCL